MGQNRKKTQPKAAGILLVTVFMLIIFIGRISHAQQEAPAVQVNMDVLNAISPAAGNGYSQTEVAPKPAHPSLTGRTRATPKTQPSAQQNTRPQQQSVTYAPAPAAASTVKPAAEKPHIVSFPVQVQTRTDIYDPSLGVTPAYTGEEEKKKKKKVMDIPMPDLKPIKTVGKKHVVKKKTVIAKAVPPIPQRRPAIQQASDSFAEEMREKATKQLNEKTMIKVSRGEIDMPAVPPQTVKAEPLSPPPMHALPTSPAPMPMQVASNDALASQLVTPDKEAMIRSIESIVAFADALAPTQPAIRRIEAKPQKHAVQAKALQHKDEKANIPVPAHKPQPTQSIIAEIDEAIGLSEIAPASGTEERKIASLVDITEPSPAQQTQIPRTPPEGEHEQAYISLPFQPGINDIDKEITSSLNEDIIPLLKNNPQWRLQIQAFASKTGPETKNARRNSLSRALAVRSHLLENGIEARRMDVRALGMQTDRNPADRVDFVFFDPTEN